MSKKIPTVAEVKQFLVEVQINYEPDFRGSRKNATDRAFDMLHESIGMEVMGAGPEGFYTCRIVNIKKKKGE